MWGTSQGDRTLEGHEAALVRKSVGYLRDMITASIDLDEPYVSQVGVFNQLQPTQQLAVLHEVAFALLDPKVPIPELTAIREATIYAIYKELVTLIEMEIAFASRNANQMPHNSSAELSRPDTEFALSAPELQTRALVYAATRQTTNHNGEWGQNEFAARESPTPTILSNDLEFWATTIENLVNQVLWDRDFELESIFADHDPSKISDIKAYLGINHDYFSTPAPDAYSDEYQQLDRELVDLTRNEI